MLHIIKSVSDPLISLVKDDPVRPEIPVEKRVSTNWEIVTLLKDDRTPKAVVCIAFCDSVPASVEDLFKESDSPTVAIFYTIWSYAAGAGRDLLIEALAYIKETYKNIERFVTLSPQTELARRFHLKNGASIFRENQMSVNYEYKS